MPTIACKSKEQGASATKDGESASAEGEAKAAAEAGGGSDADAPTPEQAKAYVAEVDTKLRELWVAQSEAEWQNATDITEAHQQAVAATTEASMAYLNAAIAGAQRFEGVAADPATARQLQLLKVSPTVPAPADAAKREELAKIATKLDSMYGTGKWGCEDESADDCKDMADAIEIMATSDDYDELLAAWEGWRTISPAMRPKYQRFVELANEGARDIGYADVGELWRSGYDMAPDAFAAEMERLWQQVKPLYTALHCHVRAELAEKYGADEVPADGMIPAHLLGNLWAQEWPNVYEDMVPYPDQPSIDVTEGLKKAAFDERKMVATAEGFFVSLGLDPLPETFWERSLFVQPEGRDVQCHASAWDVGFNNDLRIKMCIKVDMEDLVTIHHELGHNYYYHYYYDEPILFQNGAHDGFHEGIGDTLALSITPSYLNQLGLLDEVSEDPEAVINKQLADGLEKIAFLPFGLLIDRWRWGVFSGEIAPGEYNAAWWKLRNEYQGVSAPVERSEANFDPGAKYHIPANTPYARYFLARILQFQFHAALCEAAGHEGPLHTCSIYGSKEAGAKLRAMLELGSSKPWPDALEVIAGTRQMDAGPMLEYFEPLKSYLEQQNEGRSCGW
ncbi:M2 family metallopeptidase [Pseudenhygromyxa sp. WMMC2535]|nr:M2 family metallopeptidase [Pseudenhygromyxa sp. WMMC2535]